MLIIDRLNDFRIITGTLSVVSVVVAAFFVNTESGTTVALIAAVNAIMLAAVTLILSALSYASSPVKVSVNYPENVEPGVFYLKKSAELDSALAFTAKLSPSDFVTFVRVSIELRRERDSEVFNRVARSKK